MQVSRRKAYKDGEAPSENVRRSSGLLLGCIADDFTGGSDAASFLAAGGMNTILLSRIPDPGFRLPDDVEAAVITLKSRTQETEQAVRDSLLAMDWLQNAGASHFYIKYCSTFDSTPKGNIGPVVDAVLEKLEEEGTLLCPALPANGRIVRDGILYVKGLPLSDSPMKDHPLTPMWESRIRLLMKPQGKYDALEIGLDALHGPKKELEAQLLSFRKKTASEGKGHWYLIPDHTDDTDGARIVSLFGHMRLLTGGSGILTQLARRLRTKNTTTVPCCEAEGPALIVAGSCSTATHAQTLWYEAQGALSLRLTDDGILSGKQNALSIWSRVGKDAAPLVYAYDSPEGLGKKRGKTGRLLASGIESVLAQTAVMARDHGVTRIIAAGGETSGAVTKALGYQAYRIGVSVAPGVPVLIPLENPRMRLILKSGNFGQEDFFARALEITAPGMSNSRRC